MKLFWILLRLQGTQILHQWRSFSQRSAWSLLFQGALAFIALLGIQLVISAFVSRLLDPVAAGELLGPLRYTRYEHIADGSARLMSVFLLLTALSGLCLPRSSRMSAWDWFQEQPTSLLPLFIHRCLIDCVLPNATALFAGPLFFALLTQSGLSWPLALGKTLLLVGSLQAMMAAPRVWLELKYRQMPGLFAPLLLLLALQTLRPESNFIVRLVPTYGSFWDAWPTSWLLAGALGQDSAWWKIGLSIVLIHAVLYALAAPMLRRPLPIPHPNGSSPSLLQSTRRRWHRLGDHLHPVTRRDLQVLLRDRQVILNVFGAPLLLLIVPVKASVGTLNPLPLVFALAFLAGLLFLLGAVFYILPMEGRSLWMLYTWPQSVSQFLQRRLRGLLALAILYSGLMFAWGVHQQGITQWFDPGRLVYALWGLGCFAQILMALAVFAWRPQEGYRWGQGRNLGLLVLGALYALFLFTADQAACGSMMLLLGAVAALLRWQLQAFLPTLLDAAPPPTRWVTGLLASLLIVTSLLWLGFHA